MSGKEFPGVEAALATIPDRELASQASAILYSHYKDAALPDECTTFAKDNDITVAAYEVGLRSEADNQMVRIAVAQNRIHCSTSASTGEQYAAIEARIDKIIDAAGLAGVNVLCLQEAWTSPFFFCTREKVPWCEFAEDPYTGKSTKFIMRKAAQWNMVIVSPIFERDSVRSGVIWNTAVIVSNRGKVLGTHRKNHIPSVGLFNEANYYRDGDDGWPVFETEFGRIAVNICYGRHHPLNWQAFALNGAEIIFNPSATVGSLSEPLWGIEARNAAIANSVFTAGCNRVGTESFPNEFTAEGVSPTRSFGHFYGSSYCAAPDGSRSPGLPRDVEGVLVAQIDLSSVRSTRDKWMFQATARLSDYAALFARFCKPDFERQIIRDPGLPAPTGEVGRDSFKPFSFSK